MQTPKPLAIMLQMFRQDLIALFGDQLASRLARTVNVNTRTAQKWLAGEATLPDDVKTHVAEQLRLLEKSDLEDKLEALVKEFMDKGGHPEVAAAQLARIYSRTVKRDIE